MGTASARSLRCPGCSKLPLAASFCLLPSASAMLECNSSLLVALMTMKENLFTACSCCNTLQCWISATIWFVSDNHALSNSKFVNNGKLRQCSWWLCCLAFALPTASITLVVLGRTLSTRTHTDGMSFLCASTHFL